MKIIQWNMTSYFTQFEELKNLIQETEPDCLCLQETRHGNKNAHPPSGYRIVQSTPNQNAQQANNSNAPQQRGVAILIGKKINYKIVPLSVPDPIEVVAAQIYSGRYYTVCSLYLSPNQQVTKRDLVMLLEQLPKPFLILGDMNARQ